MTRVNSCVKISFFVANVFFAVLGGLIVALALLLQLVTRFHDAPMAGRFAVLTALYVVGLITMAIAAVGAYGAHRQSRAALIVFLVCMVIGTLMMFRVAVPLAAVRPEVEEAMSDTVRELLPLDEADEKIRVLADDIQKTLRCCGAFSYSDWRQNIPDSCACDVEAEREGKCQLVSYDLMMLQVKKVVFRQPCFPLLARYFLLILDVIIGLSFVLAALALLGLILSSILIHQLRPGVRPAVLLVPAIFKPQPPKYEELHNAPVY
ncbi:tetraspanin-8-like [Corythoichthys intestinalis]|uniref:tetraspanin-8-like n=1 Tax=Corythoichthys intestinalis TaxID=161448 RepID=UPI0025A523F2|nr:tetraspanin-8-like [Corythoichthys intestinalis]XP_061809606.1 tetraspanin-8-like [Nerophis lumbriciformis]